jgi:hypothetical protein
MANAFKTGISHIHNITKKTLGVVGRPVAEGAAGAGAAHLVGRYIPAVGGPIGMGVSAVVVAGVSEGVLWGFGREASVQATEACKGLQKMTANYDSADADGRKAIETSIRDYMGTEKAAMADAFVMELRASSKKKKEAAAA